jgi:predicted SAM-dependent methyltransferase
MDGVYNLGVMEHFTEAEIRRILAEFRRVLRRDGRVLIFWPPERGTSVLFFKALTIFFRVVLRRKHVRFHPDEITRVRSRQQVFSLFEGCGLKIVRYYFGPLDAFTHVVIVADRADRIEVPA